MLTTSQHMSKHTAATIPCWACGLFMRTFSMLIKHLESGKCTRFHDPSLLVQALGEWGVTWSFTDPRPEELDPDLLIVWMARHVDHDELPADRTVVQFNFRNPAKRYWMVLEPSEVSVCLQHPGFDIDLDVPAAASG